jgi:NADH:ubiquinone oxidoreductase subunit F (NADH-binding)
MTGNRACPDCRPPFPAQSGFLGKPTAVNNVETLANVPHIIDKGADWFAKFGVEGSTGTKLFCLSGHINKPGLYEIPFGITLGELINDYGGGVKGEFKAALTGGVSSSLVTDMNIKLDYRSVAAAGSMLGSASVIVMNKDTDMVDVAVNTVSFFALESCGKCSVCREGTRQAQKILANLSRGRGRPGDIELLQELGSVLQDTACCGLGQASMNVPVSAIKYFRNEFEDRQKEGNR